MMILAQGVGMGDRHRDGGAKKKPADHWDLRASLNSGGAKEDRTPDLVIANDALSQLSYGPTAHPV